MIEMISSNLEFGKKTDYSGWGGSQKTQSIDELQELIGANQV